MIAALLISILVCSFVPAILFCINLRRYATPPEIEGGPLSGVSVLIPARDEALGIGDAVRCALASSGIEFEVVVMDDGSSDGTDAIVLAFAVEDARVRLERAPALPRGWNGKQHTCWALAQAARYPVLCFVDADVRLGARVRRAHGSLSGGERQRPSQRISAPDYRFLSGVDVAAADPLRTAWLLTHGQDARGNRSCVRGRLRSVHDGASPRLLRLWRA